MWRKRSELQHLIALRKAAAEAMQGIPLIQSEITMNICIYADPHQGDLDNFITGICDGLMAAHRRTPVDLLAWMDLPEEARPDHPICFQDDVLIQLVTAERKEPDARGSRYIVELEW